MILIALDTSLQTLIVMFQRINLFLGISLFNFYLIFNLKVFLST